MTVARHKGNVAFVCACAHVCLFVCSSACVSVSEQHANKYLCLLLPSGGFDPVPSGSSWGCGPSSSSSDDCSAPVPSPLHPSTPPFTPLPPYSVSSPYRLISISELFYHLNLFVLQNIQDPNYFSLNIKNKLNGNSQKHKLTIVLFGGLKRETF